MSYDLWLSDSHQEPGQDFSRFECLGRMMRRERPKTLIFGGDGGNFDSVSKHHVKGSQTQRDTKPLKVELDTVGEAFAYMKSQWKTYRPERMIFFEGNHEYRIEKWKNENSETQGLFSLSEQKWMKGWEFVPYRGYLQVNGVTYCHCVHNAINKPIEGVTATRKIAEQGAPFTIYGHTHKFQIAVAATLAGGQPKVAVAGPCFMEEDYVPPYAQGSAQDWTYGLLRVIHVHGLQKPDIEMVSTGRMKVLYA